MSGLQSKDAERIRLRLLVIDEAVSTDAGHGLDHHLHGQSAFTYRNDIGISQILINAFRGEADQREQI